MPELGYLLLAGTVLFFVVVLWLFPDDASRRRDAARVGDSTARRSDTRVLRPAAGASRPATSRLRTADRVGGVEPPVREREVPDDDLELSLEEARDAFEDDGTGLHPDGGARPSTGEVETSTSAPIVAGAVSIAVSPTIPSESGGASDHTPRRTFPEAIAIPVAMTAATPPAKVQPPIREVPFATNSARVPVTWSPRAAVQDPPRWATQSWRATSSVVARVSAIELPGPDDPRRRGLLIAAGAGLVVVLAVAARR